MITDMAKTFLSMETVLPKSQDLFLMTGWGW